MNRILFLKNKAKEIRRLLLETAFNAKSGHIGSALSTVDLITALYFEILNVNPKKPLDPKRDIFILSKGHGCLGLYAVLAEKGYFSKKHLITYFKDKTILAGHPVLGSVPGIEASTGSLGHGLPIGIGLSLASKLDRKNKRVVVMLSDGECDEGSTWEAILAAANLGLGNLTAIVDYNKIQSFGTVKEIMDLEPFAGKWKSFNWNVIEINGHNFKDILNAFKKTKLKKNKPTVIIAHTVKGKGVSFMENKVEWHYFNIIPEMLKQIKKELK